VGVAVAVAVAVGVAVAVAVAVGVGVGAPVQHSRVTALTEIVSTLMPPPAGFVPVS
jgi:hypothetical protein